jgi:hypothetical protein
MWQTMDNVEDDIELSQRDEVETGGLLDGMFKPPSLDGDDEQETEGKGDGFADASMPMKALPLSLVLIVIFTLLITNHFVNSDRHISLYGPNTSGTSITPSAGVGPATTDLKETIFLEYEYDTTDMKHEPTGIFTSLEGDIVIAADKKGYVYASSDFGTTFAWSRPLQVGSGKMVYAAIYGLAMSSSGKTMLAGTAQHSNYYSGDWGTTWETRGSDSARCGIIAGTSDLKELVCIGGSSDEANYIYYSSDYGENWTKTTAEKKQWVGLVASQDMSRIVALEYDGWAYVSTDKGTTFTAHEGEANKWGCLAGSSNAMTLLITDSETGNAHGSLDGGETWSTFYTNVKGDTITIGPCAVSSDGLKFALGFDGKGISFTSDLESGFTANEVITSWVSQDQFGTSAEVMAASSDLSVIHIGSSDKKIYSGSL